MARCEECLHFEVCEALEQGNGLVKVSPIHCGYYKPTADVVEVVRCKDCKNARGNLMSIGICDCLKYRDMRQGDDFCNYGERRAEI